MKYRYHFVTIMFLPLLLLVSCKKYEQTPVDFMTDDYVYDSMDKNGDYARRVLNHLYTYLPNGYNRIDNVVLGAATDDAIASDNYSNIETLSKSRLNALTDNPDGRWYEGYEAIREANLFLQNIGEVPVDSTLKQYWKAEARFIRSINYFELIKRYGGVPLVGDSLFAQSEQVDISRSSYNQCVQYLISELNDITSLLRPSPATDPEMGRITQGAALALKSRVLLYAASPLNNPGNDLSKWQAAADASGEVMDLNVYSLANSYYYLFIDANRINPELILSFQRSKTESLERNNAPVGYAEPNQSNGYVSPTQELVDAFPMNNGLPIDDPDSGYDPQDPYQNRDPRLAFTVFYNGSIWLQRSVETFEGGLDNPNSVQRKTKTGYYMRKFLFDYSDQNAYGNQNHNFPIFRYAEILLNYAEAENELGNTNIAYDQLKTIRDRAGISPGVNDMYGLKSNMTQEEMREAVRRERRIEMAFEEQRYWDIRRWKIADQVANKQLHGIHITKNSNDTFTYEVVPVFKIIFTASKMYRYPIPYNEVAGNLAIEQNPGWE